MSDGTTMTLDVRDLPPWERHPRIFETLDGLAPGQALRLVNDHDPKPLHYELMAERPEQFLWETRQEGERTWVAMITKRA